MFEIRKNLSRTVLVFFCIISLIFHHIPAFASSLDNFKSGVKKEKQKKSSSSSSSSSNSSSSSSDNLFAELLFELVKAFFIVTISHNSKTGYSYYPYSKDSPVKIDKNPENALKENSSIPEFVSYDSEKKWMSELSIAYQYVPEGSHGIEGSVHGKVHTTFGPELSYTQLQDNDDTLQHYAIGINYTIFQLDGFLLDTYLQYTGMSGMLEMNGGGFGFLLNLYPIQPLTLKAKYGWELYEDISFTNCELRAGAMLDRYELFAGYEWLWSDEASLNGVKCGITLHC